MSPTALRSRLDRAPLLLAIAYVATRLPFLHAGGSPDGDAQHIALGVLQGALDGTGIGASRAYGVPFSRGAYLGLLALEPLFGRDPKALFACMNGLGFGFGLLAQISVYGLLRAVWGRSAAIFGAVLWLFAPGVWELNTYGHPTPAAFALLVAALWVQAGGRRESSAPHRIAVAALAFAAAVSIRTDIAIFAPAFPLVGAWRRRSASGALLGLVPVAAAALVLAASRTGAGAPQALGLVQRALTLASVSPEVAAKKLVTLALGIGLITALAIPAGPIAALRRRQVWAVAFAVAGAVPALWLWLQIEGPYRHLLGASFFLVVPLAAAVSSWPPVRAALLALAIALANQLAAAATVGPVLDRASFGYRPVAGERRWTWRAPIGDWFSNHAAAARGVRRDQETANAIADSPAPRLLVLAQSPYRAEIELVARFGPYPIEQRFADPALWVTHRPPGREVTFLVGDPPYVRAALSRVPADSLAGFEVLIPPGQEPNEPFVLPGGPVR